MNRTHTQTQMETTTHTHKLTHTHTYIYIYIYIYINPNILRENSYEWNPKLLQDTNTHIHTNTLNVTNIRSKWGIK